MTTSLTHGFAALIATSVPSDEAVAAARLAIVDGLACALGGADDRSTGILVGTLGAGTGPSVLIGRTERADPFTAALINGHSGHVLDYDDVHASVRGHPTVVILPALLALAGTRPVAARDLIAASIVGLEAMARLGLALGSRHYETGFHATATLGTVGAAAAVAHLLRFPPDTTAVALGLAATQSAGLRLQFGTDAKPLHAGLASRAGLTAACLAEAGLSGAPDFLGGPIGFLDAFGFGATAPERLLPGWGEPWQILTPGLTLKAFPCCTAAHPVAVGALALRDADGLRPDSVEAVTLTFPPGGDAALVVSAAGTGIEARFSPEYIFAAALTDGALSIGHFDERPVLPDLAALAARVSRRHDDAAPRLSSDPATRFVVLDVTVKDGRRLSRRIEGLPGLTDARPKFRDATGDAPVFAEIPDLVARMSDEADLARLLALLGQSRP
ncbi:MmgE/PrpD family protein [Methylobacterium currus]|uniref:MmgE/PrpD family protein n=1 Tax=Methylobacterium currus TaxID=2051553 RepID=A0A2R4WVE8_9HYPH|nr:MmgE/PrpD family protein [Methylobacterium currus]AWB25509.1 MmgE/PrpD family protein [Methylobacterium currus]